MRAIVASFRRLEALLTRECPGCADIANGLAAQVADPQTASADVCWQKIWDKPIYANTRVEIAERNIGEIRPFMPGAWRVLGLAPNSFKPPKAPFKVTRIGEGKNNESFQVERPYWEQIQRDAKSDAKRKKRKGIAAYRLFAIQGAAQALRTRAERNKEAPYGDLLNGDISTTLDALENEMGEYWGYTTILHFLTDMGLACKPDIHLVRSVRFLGMNLGEIRATRPTRRQAIEINQWVRRLVEALYGDVTPQRLRYVDKTLMDFSRYKLLAGQRTYPVAQVL